MNMNLNDYILSLSFILDLVENEIFGSMTSHANRVAYISMQTARKLGLDDRSLFDIVSLGMLHDNGIISCETHARIIEDGRKLEKREALAIFEKDQSHQIIGEKNVSEFPFLTDGRDAILYHHENYDGTGPLNIKGDDIPLFAQIIRLADSIEINFDLNYAGLEEKAKICRFARENEGTLFGPKAVEGFIKASEATYFWIDLKEGLLNDALSRRMPQFHIALTSSNLSKLTDIFSKIIDNKSNFTGRHSAGLAEKVEVMCRYYEMKPVEIQMMKTAAKLHDVGKLAVSNLLLEKAGKLDKDEAELMHAHSYFTKLTLEKIKGFEKLSEWSSNHHERIDGKGYPLGLSGEELDFNSRLMSCLDVYQALDEERPYHDKFTPQEMRDIMMNLADSGGLDKSIVADVVKVFGLD